MARRASRTWRLPRMAVGAAVFPFLLLVDHQVIASTKGNNHQFLGIRQNAIYDLPSAIAEEQTLREGTPTLPFQAQSAPSPTESAACVYHNDYWFCEGVRAGYEDAETEIVISYEDGIGCLKHLDHFHCPAGPAAPCKSVAEDYDLTLHLVALFVLLAGSAIGVFFPVILGIRSVISKRVSDLFFIFQNFGSGIIISTAFIHLLYEAFVTFGDQCLDTLAYPPASPAIAMASMLVIFSLDFAATVRNHRRRADSHARVNGEETKSPTESTMAVELAGGNSPNPAHSTDLIHSTTLTTPQPVAQETATTAFGHSHDFSEIHDSGLPMDGKDKRAHWELQMLEAGICFHSMMIGVTLGAQGGAGFLSTFIAICFHQLFEGLGLGARIAQLEYPKGGAYMRWIFCLAFTLVTPVGIAIGIGVRNTANMSSQSTLLSVGILDSISAGILLYASVAQLLVGEWLAGDMRRASNQRIAAGVAALVAGLLCMSVIGKWA